MAGPGDDGEVHLHGAAAAIHARPLEEGEPEPRQERHFTPRFNAMLVRDKDEMVAITEESSAVVADARGRPRFRAEEPEPVIGLPGGAPPTTTTPAGRGK